MNGDNGANMFTTEELEALFSDDDAQATPPATEDTNTQDDGSQNKQDTGKTDDSVQTTKAFANRLKESTDKARREEREAMAKLLGFDSYDALMKSRENETLKGKGLDPEVVSPVIDELVKQRINDDPRMKELENYRSQQVKEFGKKELAELTELTNGKVTNLNQLSREVLDAWAKKGSLTKAYMEVEGANLVREIRSEQSKGSTAHLNTANGSNSADNGERLLTEEEKKYWRYFNPNMSEEELNKKTVKK